MRITQIRLKNLRCFSEIKTNLRPFTVLVGENNTGKTSFLSAYKLIYDLLYEDNPIKPSSIEDLLKDKSYKYLGKAENIIKKQSSSESFCIGATLKMGEQDQDIWQVEYTIKNGRYCEKILLQCSQDKIEVNFKKNTQMELLINGKSLYNTTTPIHFSIHFFGVISFLNNELKTHLETNKLLNSKINSLIAKEKENLNNRLCNLLDPIHLRPKAQYRHSEIKTTDPSYILCEMAEMKKQNNNWSKIRNGINDFGKKSKLFQSMDIDVSDKNNGESSFSIKIKVDELTSDITNVGYGVSQFLPILAHVFVADPQKYNTFLMQQPETHLHPRVESEFTTLAVQMINSYKEKYKFIYETHSDYIIQRACIEIQKKKLDPQDFLILYFEFKNGTAQVSPVTIDISGNLENQPDSYREFFLSEDYDFLGLKD